MARFYSLNQGAHHVTGGVRLYNRAVNRMRRRNPPKPQSKPAHVPKETRARDNGALFIHERDRRRDTAPIGSTACSAHVTSLAPLGADEGPSGGNNGQEKGAMNSGTTHGRKRSASALGAANGHSIAAKKAKPNSEAGRRKPPQGAAEERCYFLNLTGATAGGMTHVHTTKANASTAGRRLRKCSTRGAALENTRRHIIASLSRGPPFLTSFHPPRFSFHPTSVPRIAPICCSYIDYMDAKPAPSRSAAPSRAGEPHVSSRHPSAAQRKAAPQGDHGPLPMRPKVKEEQEDVSLVPVGQEGAPQPMTEKVKQEQGHHPLLIDQTVQERERVPLPIGQTVQKPQNVPVPISPKVEHEYRPVPPMGQEVKQVPKPFPTSPALQLEHEDVLVPMSQEVKQEQRPVSSLSIGQTVEEDIPFFPMSQQNFSLSIGPTAEEDAPFLTMGQEYVSLSINEGAKLEQQRLSLERGQEVEQEHGHTPCQTSPELKLEREFAPVFFMSQDHVPFPKRLELEYESLPFSMGQDFTPFSMNLELAHEDQDFTPFSMSPELMHAGVPFLMGQDLTPFSMSPEENHAQHYVPALTPYRTHIDNMVPSTAWKTMKPRDIQIARMPDRIQYKAHQSLNMTMKPADIKMAPRPLRQRVETRLGALAARMADRVHQKTTSRRGHAPVPLGPAVLLQQEHVPFPMSREVEGGAFPVSMRQGNVQMSPEVEQEKHGKSLDASVFLFDWLLDN
eukprot:GEMP01027820.1.p1 GENE.GEMP01027820.1~~GEMP01027820.1.p1  ORF type:complete len:732 (+),score=158.01 GEMP01027820.1:69-2264(+)